MASYAAASNSIIEAITMARINGQVVMMVRHYRQQPASVSYTDGRATLQDFLSQWDATAGYPYTEWAANASTEVSFFMHRAQFIWPVRFAYESFIPTLPAGALAPPTSSQNQAIAFTVQSDGVGRSARATVHMAGSPAADLTNGLVTPAALTTLVTLKDALAAPIIILTPAVTLLPCIYTRSSPADSQIITHGTIQPEARVMRRRTVGLGI